MNTLTKSFAKRVISMLLVTIMVFSLGIVGLTSASAADVEMAETGGNHGANAYLYFIKPSGWSNVSMLIGHNSYSEMRTFTQLTGNLYYLKMVQWDGWTQWAIIDATGWTSSNEQVSGRIANLSNKTDINTSYEFGANNTYLIKTTTANTVWYENGYEGLDSVQYAYAQVSTDGGATGTTNSSAGTVSISTKQMTNNGVVSSSTGTNSATAANGSTVTMTATEKDGYTFLGWYNSSGRVSTSKTYSYTCSGSSVTRYARFEKSVSIDSPTATIGSEGGTSASAVVGNPVDITVDYSVTGSTNTPTLTLCDASGNTIGNAYNVEINDKVITVTPPNAGDYTFKVKVEVDGVSEFTNEVTLEYKNEYSASLSVDVEGATAYTDDPFVFTLTDNADLYDSATYEVYCNDELVDVQWDGKSFTVSHSEAGDYTYIVKATVTDGTETKEVYTNDVKIAVKAKIFNITLSSDVTAILENRDFTITAASEFAQGAVTYKLEATDGTLIEGNTNGIFNVTAKDVAENAGSEVITYTVTANDGNTEVTATIQITVNEDKGEFPVKIFFKCSDTYGYLPNAKINGAEVDLVVSDKIICKNATDSATYSWYSYTSATDTPYGTDFVFEVNANRNYFYNVSYTVTAGEGKYDFDGTYYCYYLAIENLNGGTNTLTNISTMTEANRNWTYSAVNMIYDDADASVPVGLNYSYAAIADANTDGSVNIKDATYIQKNLAKAVDASELSELVSDVNGDGKVTIKDATAIQKQLAGL